MTHGPSPRELAEVEEKLYEEVKTMFAKLEIALSISSRDYQFPYQ